MLSDVRDRLGGVDHRLVDTILALAAIVAIELTCWLTSGVSASDRVITAVAAVLFAAPIAVRRVWPAVALVFSPAVVTVSTPFGGQLLSNDNAYVIPVLVLGYSAGAWLDTRRSVVALSLGLALLWAWALLPGPDGSTTGLGQTAWAFFYVTVLLVPTWLVGRFVRRHGARAARFRELAAQVAAEQDAHDAAAIADERARIGSELQDIIAHSISAMVIQAGSARLLLRSDPGRARESILNVEETGRQALSDVRRLLGMLRKDDDPRALSPQPGLSQLSALIDSLRRRRASVRAAYRRRSDRPDPRHRPRRLPGDRGGLRAAADRHVRHGLVTVHYEPRDIELEIRGDRAIPDLDTTVAPLVQRVALYDGELRTEQAHRGLRPVRAHTSRGGRPGMTVSVLIADDQALVRTGFRMILETDPEIRVVAEAGDGTQAVDASRRTRPDIALMDIRMPVMDGLEATRQLLAGEAPPRVLMLTTFDLDEYVFDALVAGASGFLLKDVAPEHLLAAIHTIARGDSLLAPSVTRRLIEAYVRDHPPAAAPASRPGRADRARARDPRAHRARSLQRRDRRTARRLAAHDQDARRPRARQAQPARPHPGSRPRLRDRHRPSRKRPTTRQMRRPGRHPAALPTSLLRTAPGPAP